MHNGAGLREEGKFGSGHSTAESLFFTRLFTTTGCWRYWSGDLGFRQAWKI